MSLQQPAPEPKRSKPRENANANANANANVNTDANADVSSSEASEAINRRLQRELLAAAAEKRMLAQNVVKAQNTAVSNPPLQQGFGSSDIKEKSISPKKPLSPPQQVSRGKRTMDVEGQSLSAQEADQLYKMVFGNVVSKDILSQRCNQGFRYAFTHSPVKVLYIFSKFHIKLWTFTWNFKHNLQAGLSAQPNSSAPAMILRGFLASVLPIFLDCE